MRLRTPEERDAYMQGQRAALALVKTRGLAYAQEIIESSLRLVLAHDEDEDRLVGMSE